MIKYDPKLESLMRSVVGRYNSKINRLAAKNASHLPPLVTVDDLKTKHVNRSELFRELRQLDLFGESGMEDVITTEGGVKMSRWEYETLRSDVSLSKRRLTTKIRDRLSTETGYPSDRLRSLTAERNYLDRQLRKASYSQIRSLRKISSKYSRIHQTDENFKGTFLKMLERMWGGTGVLSKEEIDKLIEKYSKLTGEELSQAYEENRVLQDLMEMYRAFTVLEEYEDRGYGEYLSQNITSYDAMYDALSEQADDILKSFKK